MEERVPSPPPDAAGIDEPPLEPPALRSKIYLVQAPKDQIYRVPPPENALIVERYRNPVHKNTSRCSILLWIFIVILVLALIVGICAVIFIALKPKNPKFFIEHVVVKNSHSHRQHPDFNIILKAENPNDGMGILYQKGGSASLSFKDIEFANGKPLAFYQGYKDSKVFQVTLTGSDVLPHEIQRSMKGQGSKVRISLSLSIDVPVRMKIGVLQTWTMNMAISCDLTVNTLEKAKDTHILSQECHTKV